MSKRSTDTVPKAGSGKTRTRERREERLKQRRRNQQIAVVVGLVMMVGIVFVLFFIANQPASAPIPEEVLTRYEGIPQTRNEDGYFVLGNPNAPVRVEEYSSFSCPGCAQFHQEAFDGIIQMVREGRISFTFIPQRTGSIPNAEGAARAALCAGEQGMFYEFHDVLFDWHLRYVNRAFTQNRLISGIENLGLDRQAYDRCISSDQPGEIIEQAIEEGQERGVSGTPSTFVNGVAVSPTLDAIRQAVDQAIEFTGAAPVPLGSETEVTPEVMPETTQAPSEETSVPTEPTDEATAEPED